MGIIVSVEKIDEEWLKKNFDTPKLESNQNSMWKWESESELRGYLEAKNEFLEKAEEFYNEFDLANHCTPDDKLFKRLWRKYFKEKK